MQGQRSSALATSHRCQLRNLRCPPWLPSAPTGCPMSAPKMRCPSLRAQVSHPVTLLMQDTPEKLLLKACWKLPLDLSSLTTFSCKQKSFFAQHSVDCTAGGADFAAQGYAAKVCLGNGAKGSGKPEPTEVETHAVAAKDTPCSRSRPVFHISADARQRPTQEPSEAAAAVPPF